MREKNLIETAKMQGNVMVRANYCDMLQNTRTPHTDQISKKTSSELKPNSLGLAGTCVYIIVAYIFIMFIDLLQSAGVVKDIRSTFTECVLHFLYIFATGWSLK